MIHVESFMKLTLGELVVKLFLPLNPWMDNRSDRKRDDEVENQWDN